MKDSDFKQLNILLTEHDKVWSLCPFHKDIVRPNLSISLLDKYYGRWKCWACGRNGSLTKEQVHELNLSGYVIYNDNKNLDTRWRMFNQSCYDNLQKFPLLKLGLAKQLNISTKSLDEWLVGYDGSSFTIPMFREDLLEYFREGGFCGIQRRFPDGSKRCVTGSHLGLMYPRNYIGDYYIFICEGFSDGISVWDLGLQSLARPHCMHTEGIEEFFEDILDGVEVVVIIPDNDVVGMEGAKKLRGMLYQEYECYIYRLTGAKDIRELVQIKGKGYVRQALGTYI
ncbi:hypothetical protein LCGC14_0404210 [marine sediment metagenome]|uniref:Zinc finger CHC2-type domain-containing protein n=1 Tax=marine sediment metagenome TaxID=412755 RepID=A0A0F9TDW7_9ZZZZ